MCLQHLSIFVWGYLVELCRLGSLVISCFSVSVQAVRGGRTKLAHLTAPQAEYQHETKGDALHAMELALSLEKLNFQKLRHLHDVAEESKDAQMSDFVEDMLADQVCTPAVFVFFGACAWCHSCNHVLWLWKFVSLSLAILLLATSPTIIV